MSLVAPHFARIKPIGRQALAMLGRHATRRALLAAAPIVAWVVVVLISLTHGGCKEKDRDSDFLSASLSAADARLELRKECEFESVQVIHSLETMISDMTDPKASAAVKARLDTFRLNGIPLDLTDGIYPDRDKSDLYYALRSYRRALFERAVLLQNQVNAHVVDLTNSRRYDEADAERAALAAFKTDYCLPTLDLYLHEGQVWEGSDAADRQLSRQMFSLKPDESPTQPIDGQLTLRIDQIKSEQNEITVSATLQCNGVQYFNTLTCRYSYDPNAMLVSNSDGSDIEYASPTHPVHVDHETTKHFSFDPATAHLLVNVRQDSIKDAFKLLSHTDVHASDFVLELRK